MEQPTFDAKTQGPVSSLIYLLVRISEFFSLGSNAYRWLGESAAKTKGERKGHPAFDPWFWGLYVLGWLTFLLVVLAWAPLDGTVGLVFAALAIYRLQDMVFGTIGDAFIFNTIGGSGTSKVILAVMNVFQIVVIFAIAFYVLVPNTAFDPTVPTGRFGHLFLSWNTLPPLGNGFLAQTTRARSMSMIESGAGVIITIIALSRFLTDQDSGSASGTTS